MEDQQPDSGDLTTDATPETSTPRHRMPRGKERRALKTETPEPEAPPEADETVTADEPTEAAAEEPGAVTAEGPTEAAELTTSSVEEAQPKPRRRWNLMRRKKDEAEPVVATETVDEAQAPEEQESGEQTGDPTADEKPDTQAVPDAEATDDAVAEETAAAGPEPVLVPHRPAGKRLKIAAATAAVLFVAGMAFIAAMAQPVIANHAMVQTKLHIARTAQSAITTLWSYTPDNMDSLADRSARYLTGDFASQYRKFIDSIVATNKQAQVTNTTSVLGTAVESVSASEASALVYTNSVATSPVSKNIPSLRYLSYRLEMKRDRADWRITRMTTVTTLDLTPQL